MPAQYIKAPYNFVPISDNVFFPKWAGQISHDIPFEDGESGTITLKITAHSPIFVRNGHTPKDKEGQNGNYKSFSKDGKNRYFIPGTSIKGAIRNVLEIMSFSKISQVEDDSFGLRDLNNKEDYREKMVNIHCGWLQLTGNEYILIDCGEPGRISLTEVDTHFKTTLVPFVLKKQNFKTDFNRTAKAKYNLIGKSKLVEGCFVKDEKLAIAMNSKNTVDKRKFMKFSIDSNGEKGTLVLTGQPGVREQKQNKNGELKWQGKFYEFIFLEKDNPIKVSLKFNSEIIKSFKSIHKNSPDFVEFWGKKLKIGEKIPVFFKYLDEKRGEIESIGLSYLYKIPFKYSPFDLLPNDHKKVDGNFQADLAESLFGYINKKQSLKGRVHIGHAIANKNAEPDEEIRIALGGPKASYYPLYLEQEGENGRVLHYNTYSDTGANISGWKRYPVRKGTNPQCTGNDNIDTIITPLKGGTTFNLKISFHNLKKAEIGALLSAITFHNNPEYYHLIGSAKPYGYGKVKFELTDYRSLKYDLADYLCEFEEELVESPLFNGNLVWHNSGPIKNLFTMSFDSVDASNTLLQYMHMDNNRENNDFLNAKKFNKFLDLYANTNSPKFPKSIYAPVCTKKRAEKAEREKKENDERILREANRLAEQKRINDLEIQKRKEEKAKAANEKGLNLDGFKIKQHDAWPNLCKIVKMYACTLHKINDYDKLVESLPNGVLPEKDHDTVIITAKAIRDIVKKNEKEKWDAPFDNNFYKKKLAQWIGKAKAQQFPLT